MQVQPSLAHGNRLQRAYHRWALPYYEQIGAKDPGLREEIEELDRILYSRQGLGIWAGGGCAVAGSTLGLAGAGLPWAAALGAAVLFWLAIGFIALVAWLQPAGVGLRSPQNRRVALASFLITPLLAVLGFAVGHTARHGRLDLLLLGERLLEFLPRLLLGASATVAGLLLLALGVASASRRAKARRLAQLQLLAERDAARASAAEAGLRLLQAQIQPHFVFNTLSTLQHWVDRRDERASPLLRELTGFLRRSTEMLGRATVPLAEEAQAVAHYLAIQQARQGERLRFDIDIAPATAPLSLPPGLLLTLVENAVGHGLEPKIGGGSVRIVSSAGDEGWRLQVDDDGLGLAAEARDGVGLGNLRQRLQHHFGDSAHFELGPRPGGGTRAEIRFEARP